MYTFFICVRRPTSVAVLFGNKASTGVSYLWPQKHEQYLVVAETIDHFTSFCTNPTFFVSYAYLLRIVLMFKCKIQWYCSFMVELLWVYCNFALDSLDVILLTIFSRVDPLKMVKLNIDTCRQTVRVENGVESVRTYLCIYIFLLLCIAIMMGWKVIFAPACWWPQFLNDSFIQRRVGIGLGWLWW